MMIGVLVFTGFAILFLLATGSYIGSALGVTGLLLDLIFAPEKPLYLFMAEMTWIPSTNFVLVAVPLFILMGELILRCGLADRLYQSLASWLNVIPGGMLHTNVASCAVFSAVSGSSIATAATMGTVALPFFKRAKYNERMALGSLAASGTLGILIPPSIAMILYGALTGTSVGRLFLAGVIPGLILAMLFSIFIALVSLARPGIAPHEQAVSWGVRLRGLLWVLPPVGLMLLVTGSIYAGFATPTEAAGLGVVGVVVLALPFGRLDRRVLIEAFESTARTTAMFMFIFIGAFIFTFVISTMGVTRDVSQAVINSGIPPLGILGLIMAFYIILGMLIDESAMVVTTIPVVFPTIKALGAENPGLLILDPVAFGIMIVLVMQASLISPPVGLNLYVLQGVRKDHGPMIDVIIGSAPFFFIIVGMMVLVTFFPQLALWLPDKAFGA